MNHKNENNDEDMSPRKCDEDMIPHIDDEDMSPHQQKREVVLSEEAMRPHRTMEKENLWSKRLHGNAKVLDDETMRLHYTMEKEAKSKRFPRKREVVCEKAKCPHPSKQMLESEIRPEVLKVGDEAKIPHYLDKGA